MDNFSFYNQLRNLRTPLHCNLKRSSLMNAGYNVPKLTKDSLNGLTLLVSIAFIKRSFTQMKVIKTRLQNSLTEGRLTQLMRISIESPDKLTEDEIEVILDIWNRKPRRISI